LYLSFDRGDLRLGLTDVLSAGSRLDQPQLRYRDRTVGANAIDLQLGIPRIEPRNEVTLSYTVAFRYAQLYDSTAHFRRHLDLGGFDLSRHAKHVGWFRLAAPCKTQQGGSRKDLSSHVVPHVSLRSIRCVISRM
jgi:hypothetical protein